MSRILIRRCLSMAFVEQTPACIQVRSFAAKTVKAKEAEKEKERKDYPPAQKVPHTLVNELLKLRIEAYPKAREDVVSKGRPDRLPETMPENIIDMPQYWPNAKYVGGKIAIDWRDVLEYKYPTYYVVMQGRDIDARSFYYGVKVMNGMTDPQIRAIPTARSGWWTLHDTEPTIKDWAKLRRIQPKREKPRVGFQKFLELIRYNETDRISISDLKLEGDEGVEGIDDEFEGLGNHLKPGPRPAKLTPKQRLLAYVERMNASKPKENDANGNEPADLPESSEQGTDVNANQSNAQA